MKKIALSALILTAVSFISCESKSDKFANLVIRTLRSYKEMEKLAGELSEEEMEAAEKKISRELGGELFDEFITEFLFSKNNGPTAPLPVSEEYSVQREVLDYYTSLEAIRTKTNDAHPANVTVKVILGYKKDDYQTPSEITSRNIQIIDFLRRYFTQRTEEELKPQNEDVLRKDIKDRINDEILSSGKIKDVAFTQFDVVGEM